MRPYRRAQRDLDVSIRLIETSREAATVSEQALERRPVRASRRLMCSTRRLAAAGQRLLRAQRELAEANECLVRAPEGPASDVPILMDLAAKRWEAAARYLEFATSEVALRQVEVLAGLVCGELVPEHPSDSRPRIVLIPRPAPVRAFLAARPRPRVTDRIAPLLRRRRHTPLPAEVRVPKRNLAGRAPPLSSTCLL